MSNKSKGTERENRVCDKLAEQDYYPIRSDHSYGEIDVIGVYVGQDKDKPLIRLVQSKSNGHYSNNKDVEPLRMFLRLFREDVIIKGLATVELWDWINRKHNAKITIIGFTKEADYEEEEE